VCRGWSAAASASSSCVSGSWLFMISISCLRFL
jgi:hypothetical protein